MPRLVSTVHVRNPRTGKVEALRAGTDLPRWADGLVAEKRLEPEVDPRTVPVAMPEPAASEVASVGEGDGVGGEAPTPDRPHGNAGRDAWAAYAEALGLDVPADATKGDIKRLIDGDD